MSESMLRAVAMGTVLGSVLVLFVLLHRLGQAWPEVDGWLRRMWPVMGVFELSVGVFLITYDQWISAVPLLVLGIFFLLRNPVATLFNRRYGALMVDQPEPPENVRIQLPDGTEVPVELTYEGYHHGRHMWVAVSLVKLPVVTGAAVLVDKLPPRTHITIGAIADHDSD